MPHMGPPHASPPPQPTELLGRGLPCLLRGAAHAPEDAGLHPAGWVPCDNGGRPTRPLLPVHLGGQPRGQHHHPQCGAGGRGCIVGQPVVPALAWLTLCCRDGRAWEQHISPRSVGGHGGGAAACWWTAASLGAGPPWQSHLMSRHHLGLAGLPSLRLGILIPAENAQG